MQEFDSRGRVGGKQSFADLRIEGTSVAALVALVTEASQNSKVAVLCPADIRSPDDPRVLDVVRQLNASGVCASARFDTTPRLTGRGIVRALDALMDFCASLEGDRLVEIVISPKKPEQR